MLDRYPLDEPAEFASGGISSEADPKYCIDKLSRPKGEPIGKRLKNYRDEVRYILR